jgi:hypothetical protein
MGLGAGRPATAATRADTRPEVDAFASWIRMASSSGESVAAVELAAAAAPEAVAAEAVAAEAAAPEAVEDAAVEAAVVSPFAEAFPPGGTGCCCGCDVALRRGSD